MYDKATPLLNVHGGLASVGYAALRIRKVSLAQRWRNLRVLVHYELCCADMMHHIQSDDGMGMGKNTIASFMAWSYSARYGCVTSGLEKYPWFDKGAAYVRGILG